jgi:hypothetical protein
VQVTPAQDRAANEIVASLPSGNVVLFRADTGMGRTTVLTHVHAETGGAFVGARHFIDALIVRRPDAIEQAFTEMLEDVLASHRIVIVDDLHRVTWIAADYKYHRRYLLDAALEAILGSAKGRRLVVATDDSRVPQPVWNRASVVKLGDFRPEDYRALAQRISVQPGPHHATYIVGQGFAPAAGLPPGVVGTAPRLENRSAKALALRRARQVKGGKIP